MPELIAEVNAVSMSLLRARWVYAQLYLYVHPPVPLDRIHLCTLSLTFS
jgi:hypothetical protein